MQRVHLAWPVRSTSGFGCPPRAMTGNSDSGRAAVIVDSVLCPLSGAPLSSVSSVVSPRRICAACRWSLCGCYSGCRPVAADDVQSVRTLEAQSRREANAAAPRILSAIIYKQHGQDKIGTVNTRSGHGIRESAGWLLAGIGTSAKSGQGRFEDAKASKKCNSNYGAYHARFDGGDDTTGWDGDGRQEVDSKGKDCRAPRCRQRTRDRFALGLVGSQSLDQSDVLGLGGVLRLA